MNIIAMCYIDLDKMDGQAIHFTEIINNFYKLDNVVTVLCPSFRKKNGLHCSNIIKVPMIKDRPVVNSVMFQGLFCIMMMVNVFMHKTDIIYIRHVPFNILPILISKIMRIPCIIEVNYSIKELKTLKISKGAIFAIMIVDKIAYSIVDNIIVITSNLKDSIHSIYNTDINKISVVPNGADIYKFRPMVGAKDILKLDKNFWYICFVGHVELWQGIDCIIKSVPLILEKIPNIKFLIIGSGKSLYDIIDDTKKLNIYDKFLFLGDVQHEKVQIYINASDLCVAPFHKGRIASPIKIFEYMACEKPVVASDISDVGKLLRESSAGLSIEPNDYIAFAENIIKLLLDERLRSQMGKNGRKFIMENHTWEIVAKNTLKISQRDKNYILVKKRRKGEKKKK